MQSPGHSILPPRPADDPAQTVPMAAGSPLGTWAYFAWGLALLVVSVRVSIAPHENSVFTLFRQAGARWLAGQALYSHIGEYLYSPLVAAFFAPFALVPERLAGVLWRLVNATAYLGALQLWMDCRWTGRFSVRQSTWFLGLALPLSIGNLNNGQSSPLVIALLLGAVIAVGRSWWSAAALCVAVATFFKIYPLALGLVLVVLWPRQFAWRLGLALAGCGLLSLLLQRPAYVLAQYASWITSLHADTRRVSGPYGAWRDFWLLLRLLRLPITVPVYTALQVIAGALLAGFCLWGKRVDGWAVGRTLTALFCLTGCWITLFGPSTEMATYIFLAPAVTFAAASLFGHPQASPRLRWLVAAVLVLLLTSELSNSWWRAARWNIYNHAVQPIAALLFVAATVIWSKQADLWCLAATGEAGVEGRKRIV